MGSNVDLFITFHIAYPLVLQMLIGKSGFYCYMLFIKCYVFNQRSCSLLPLAVQQFTVKVKHLLQPQKWAVLSNHSIISVFIGDL